MYAPGKDIGGAGLGDAVMEPGVENTEDRVLHSARFRFGTGLAIYIAVNLNLRADKLFGA
jgi:hypothetical protein